MSSVHFSVGTNFKDNKPQNHSAPDFDSFEQVVTHKFSTARVKHLTYITAAFNTKGFTTDRGGYRASQNVLSRNWIAFDFDKLTPETLPLVKEFMQQWRGFGYHTSSHTEVSPKYRIILSLSRDVDRVECIQVGRYLNRALQSELGDSAVSDESTFRGEQPVYTPLLGTQIESWQGGSFDVQVVFEAPKPPSSGITRPDSSFYDISEVFDPDDAIAKILKADNYHDSVNSLALRYANLGMDEREITSFMRGLFFASSEQGTSRWRDRFDDIPRAVKSAVSIVQKEIIEEEAESLRIEEEMERDTLSDRDPSPWEIQIYQAESNFDAYPEIEYPPGFMGEIARSVSNFMYYMSREICIETALHAVNVFAGNYYIFDNVPNHRKTILLADQGRGKNTVARFMDALLARMMTKNKMSPVMEHFIGSSNHSSQRNLHLELQEFGTRSIITSEAGHVNLSKMGDRSNVTAYVNQILSCGPSYGHKPQRQNVVKGDETVRMIRHVCLSIIQESVPGRYMESISDLKEFEDGSMSRANLLFIKPLQEGFTKQVPTNDVPPEVVDCCSQIANACIVRGNACNVPNAAVDTLNVSVTPKARALLCDLEAKIDKKLVSKAVRADTFLQSQLVRKLIKVKAVARLLAVADNPLVPVVQESHVQWAIDRQDQLDQALIDQRVSGHLSEVEDQLMVECARTLRLLMSSAYKHKWLTAEEIKTYVIPGGTFTRFFAQQSSRSRIKKIRNHPRFRYYDTHKFNAEMITLMDQHGVARIVDDPSGKRRGYHRFSRGAPKRYPFLKIREALMTHFGDDPKEALTEHD
jgi:hypothetical protein